MEKDDDRISKRYLILNDIERIIQESIYYRTYSDDMNKHFRRVLYNHQDKSGSINIQ